MQFLVSFILQLRAKSVTDTEQKYNITNLTAYQHFTNYAYKVNSDAFKLRQCLNRVIGDDNLL